MRSLEPLDFLLGLVSGSILTLITGIVGYYFSKKIMKSEHDFSEKAFRIQLYQEDKKTALIELDSLLRKSYKTFPEFKRSMESFLDGSTGIFVPDKLKEELKKEIHSIDSYISKQAEEMYGIEPEYPDDSEMWIEALTPEQRLDEEIENRLRDLKSQLRMRTQKYIAGE